ncbi:MAG: biotin/lipoyl-binding protein [Candidatus Eisenbacteria bacterium]|uniref:Biotin/lipoyl-binding protein n=1 Tax=Eiseniibacteriota bacterium TaxID=2212470 RepID=A0A538TI05_UNCEI|nr:MAG: biotin/lipoyl-binding protein [Candidatus Eisenbacteria bacterium]
MTADGPADLSGLKIDRDAPPPETGRLRRVLLWGAVTVLALGGAVLAYRAANPASVPVAVARAEPLGGVPGAGATEILTANGYVVARQRASVSTEVAGRLNQLFVEEGSRVRKGQVLGVLQNADQKSALASAHAALASAEAREAEAAANARETSLARGRAQQLHAKGLVSQAELDQADASDDVAKARVKSAVAEVRSTAARVESAQVDYDKTFRAGSPAAPSSRWRTSRPWRSKRT